MALMEIKAREELITRAIRQCRRTKKAASSVARPSPSRPIVPVIQPSDYPNRVMMRFRAIGEGLEREEWIQLFRVVHFSECP